MPRARKIDAESANAAAMALFWRSGCGPVGTRQIEEETGITRFTLQTAYGGKRELFLKSLDAYLDLFEDGFVLGVDAATLAEIAAWFEMRADPPEEHATHACYGCLMLNAIAEFGATDDGVNARAARYFALLRARFAIALEKIRQSGEIRPDFDIPAQVETLVGAAIGLNLVIRSAGGNEAGKPMASGIARVIRGLAA